MTAKEIKQVKESVKVLSLMCAKFHVAGLKYESSKALDIAMLLEDISIRLHKLESQNAAR